MPFEITDIPLLRDRSKHYELTQALLGLEPGKSLVVPIKYFRGNQPHNTLRHFIVGKRLRTKRSGDDVLLWLEAK